MNGDSAEREPLVLGVDVGGTATRALLGDLAGNTVGIGHGGGGNPNSHPPEHAVEQIARATRTALTDVDPTKLGAVVVGLAGISKLADPVVRGLYEEAWREVVPDREIHTIADTEVAFAAGTHRPTGTALIAGTGSIATRIEQHSAVFSIGGHGWLLGDEGSAFWLGREAVRETLRALEIGEGTRDPLYASVMTELLPERTASAESGRVTSRRIVTNVNSSAPLRLAELAPLVTASASEGGEAAAEIVRRAARLLADTALATVDTSDSAPIVLGGSLLTPGSPVSSALRAELAERSSAELCHTGFGAAGAAWLAATELIGADTDRARLVHERFMAVRQVGPVGSTAK